MRQTICKILLVFSFLALTACKEVLFSNLAEVEANEMVAVLAFAGIASDRERDKDQNYSVLVDSAQIATATTVLRNEGYPKVKFQTIGDIFSAEGIVGTPFEQQARYIHAMNQELSHTISMIRGVENVRVLVTAPVRGRYESEDPAATAAVTINYESSFDIEANVPSIKLIIAHSLPNLAYEDVALALFPAAGPAIEFDESSALDAPEVQAMSIFPSTMKQGAFKFDLRTLLLVMGIVSIIVSGLILAYWAYRQNGKGH